jgi:hypothetical protein
MTEDERLRIEGRLNNWGRWAGTGAGGGPHGHCASAEHRYVAEKLGEDEQAIHRTVMPVDALDAEIVERAITKIPCKRSRRFLVESYVYQVARVNLEKKFQAFGALFEPYRYRVVKLAAESIANEECGLIRRGKPLWAGVARSTRRRV